MVLGAVMAPVDERHAEQPAFQHVPEPARHFLLRAPDHVERLVDLVEHGRRAEHERDPADDRGIRVVGRRRRIGQNAANGIRSLRPHQSTDLIEQSGLKGHAIGGASVSELHANFIVNPERRARAADIEQLIDHVRAAVAARTGVVLEPEVRILGEARP